MASLADLRARIADDLERSDLTGQIEDAVRDAVRRYEGERFWFNEFYRTTATLSAAATTISFTQLGIVPIGVDRLAIRFDALHWSELCEATPPELQALRDDVVSTRPGYYAVFGDAIEFDCSAASNYAVVLDGVKKISTASAAADVSAWCNDARDLIRAAAKKQIYLQIVKDAEQATACMAAEQEALAMLRAKSNARKATGTLRPTMF